MNIFTFIAPEPPEPPPVAGYYLYSSCAGADYAKILAVGHDANGCPTLDLELLDGLDLTFGLNNGDDFTEEKNPVLTELELPPGPIILRHVQYKLNPSPDYTTINCNTPGDGCYRCTKLFTIRKEASQ